MASKILRRDQVQTFFSPPLLMLIHQRPYLRSVRRRGKLPDGLDASAASTTRSTSTVMGDRRNILNPTDPEPMTSQHPDRCLRTRTRSPSTVASRCSHTDMKRS